MGVNVKTAEAMAANCVRVQAFVCRSGCGDGCCGCRFCLHVWSKFNVVENVEQKYLSQRLELIIPFQSNWAMGDRTFAAFVRGLPVSCNVIASSVDCLSKLMLTVAEFGDRRSRSWFGCFAETRTGSATRRTERTLASLRRCVLALRRLPVSAFSAHCA